MEAFRQSNTYRTFNHSGAGKANQRFWFGYYYIAHKGKASRHTAHGRVGQHADVRQTFFGQARQGRIGFGHLHQGQQALLHARTTGCREANEGHFLFDGRFNTAHKTLANDGAHAAAHEIKFEASGHHVDAVDGAAHDHQGVGFTGVAHGFFDALGVLAAVFEFQSVNRHHFLANFIAAFVVQKVI